MNLKQFVEKAKKSTLFTSPVLGKDLSKFLKEEEEKIVQMTQKVLQRKVNNIYWVGSGNSWCNLYPAKYVIDKYIGLPNEVTTGYELIWKNPKSLNENSVVFVSSYSGSTEDTLAALKFVKEKGAYTIAIVNQVDSPMGKSADEVIPFNSKALYILPMAATYIFIAELAKHYDVKELNFLKNDLHSLPEILENVNIEEEAKTFELAEKYKYESLFYVLSSGILYSVGYKYAYTVFMENMRVNGAFLETSEFRQGPVEMLERYKPSFVFLMGNDDTRIITERVISTVNEIGVNSIVFDYKYYSEKYGNLSNIFSPFILHIPLQWFSVYSAFLRGIEDLDERSFMGHKKLSVGTDVNWP